jgi:hypothetical protein
VPVGERLYRVSRGRLPDRIGHIDCVEVAGREEPIDRFEPDMVGVHMVRFLPAEFLDRGVRGGPHATRLGADNGVFAVGFVPYRDDFDPAFGRK